MTAAVVLNFWYPYSIFLLDAINFLLQHCLTHGNINFFMQVESGKVDGKRLCITGGSAGGYTTLAALAFRDTFKAGASLYGVSA